jgi:thiamine kinase-like enzyme
MSQATCGGDGLEAALAAYGITKRAFLEAVQSLVPEFSGMALADLSVCPLTGGMSNLLYIVESKSVPHHRVVARVLSPNLDAIIDRERELSIFQQLSSSGVAPRLYGVATLDVPPEADVDLDTVSLRVEEHLLGRTLDISDFRTASSEETSPAALADRVVQLHLQKPTFLENVSTFAEHVLRYLRMMASLRLQIAAARGAGPAVASTGAGQAAPDGDCACASLGDDLSKLLGGGTGDGSGDGCASSLLQRVCRLLHLADWETEAQFMLQLLEGSGATFAASSAGSGSGGGAEAAAVPAGGPLVLCHNDLQPGNWILAEPAEASAGWSACEAKAAEAAAKDGTQTAVDGHSDAPGAVQTGGGVPPSGPTASARSHANSPGSAAPHEPSYAAAVAARAPTPTKTPTPTPSRGETPSPYAHRVRRADEPGLRTPSGGSRRGSLASMHSRHSASGRSIDSLRSSGGAAASAAGSPVPLLSASPQPVGTQLGSCGVDRPAASTAPGLGLPERAPEPHSPHPLPVYARRPHRTRRRSSSKERDGPEAAQHAAAEPPESGQRAGHIAGSSPAPSGGTESGAGSSAPAASPGLHSHPARSSRRRSVQSHVSAGSRSASSRLYIIDYEYGGWNRRGFDLGNLFCEHTFNYSVATAPGYAMETQHYPSLKWQRDFLTAYAERLLQRVGTHGTSHGFARPEVVEKTSEPVAEVLAAASASDDAVTDATALPAPSSASAAEELWRRTSCAERAVAAICGEPATSAGGSDRRDGGGCEDAEVAALAWQLAKEARVGLLASHFYWSLWSSVMAGGKAGFLVSSPTAADRDDSSDSEAASPRHNPSRTGEPKGTGAAPAGEGVHAGSPAADDAAPSSPVAGASPVRLTAADESQPQAAERRLTHAAAAAGAAGVQVDTGKPARDAADDAPAPPSPAVASGHSVFDYSHYGLQRAREYFRLKEQLLRDQEGVPGASGRGVSSPRR